MFKTLVLLLPLLAVVGGGRGGDGAEVKNSSNRKRQTPTSTRTTRGTCNSLINQYNIRSRIFGTCEDANVGTIRGYCYRLARVPTRGRRVPTSRAGQHVRIPTVTYAELSRATCPRPRRNNFGSEVWVRAQMAAMNARYDRPRSRRNDEKGHLIASQVCGPIEWFNLVPQSQQLNANRRRLGRMRLGWYEMENDWADRIRHRGEQFHVYMFVDYENGRSTEPNRPSGFRVCIRPQTLTDMETDLYFYNEMVPLRIGGSRLGISSYRL